MRSLENQAVDRNAPTPVERLLRAAAEFEPETPAPGLLSSGGVLMLLAEDAQRRRRRTVRARVAALTGLMAGAAACSASLVMALTQSSRTAQAVVATGVTSAPVPKEAMVASATVASAPQKVEASAPARPRRTVRRRRSRGRARTARPKAPTVEVWTEQTVEHRMEGLLANAWVVEPQADGTLRLAPAIIDLPVDALPTADACGPVGEEASTAPQVNDDTPAPPAHESE